MLQVFHEAHAVPTGRASARRVQQGEQTQARSMAQASSRIGQATTGRAGRGEYIVGRAFLLRCAFISGGNKRECVRDSHPTWEPSQR
jgi:hypothetical protein